MLDHLRRVVIPDLGLFHGTRGGNQEILLIITEYEFGRT
jgi:hypothetical protein